MFFTKLVKRSNVTKNVFKRRLDRKSFPRHACFVCMDTRQQVVYVQKGKESGSKKKKDQYQKSDEKSMIKVYVPLIGKNCVQGVLEVANLVEKGFSLDRAAQIFQRSSEALRGLILAKEYR